MAPDWDALHDEFQVKLVETARLEGRRRYGFDDRQVALALIGAAVRTLLRPDNTVMQQEFIAKIIETFSPLTEPAREPQKAGAASRGRTRRKKD